MNLVLPCEKYKSQYYELVDSAIKNKTYQRWEMHTEMVKITKIC